MALILVKHITKLTAMILVLAALAASAFIQNVHAAKLQSDAAALKLIAKRLSTPRTDDAALLERALAWLRAKDELKATIDAHYTLRKTLVEALTTSGGVPGEAIIELKRGPLESPGAAARWALVHLEIAPEGPIEANLPSEAAPETVADALGGFLAGHRPTKVTLATSVEMGEAFHDGVDTARPIPLASVVLSGDVVNFAFSEERSIAAMNQAPPRTVRFSAPAKFVAADAPSLADLTFGTDEAAARLAADETRIKRLVRLYGDLSIADAQSTVSRVITARFNAVSLLGVQVPAEYFAVALAGGLAAVLLGLVAALRKARTAPDGPLDFMQSDAISALMLGTGWGRAVLWLVIPVVAAAAVWPDAWLDRTWFNVYRAVIGVVALLGVWAVGRGRGVVKAG